MKKQTLLYILLLITMLFLTTTDVYAKEDKNVQYDKLYTVNLTDKNNGNLVTSVFNQNINSLVQIAEGCGDSNAIFGNVNDPNSVAWLLQKALDYIRVIAPFLVLILSSIDYLKAIFSSSDENLTKTHTRFVVRLALAGVLFVLPTLVSVLLNVIGFTSNEICGLQ